MFFLPPSVTNITGCFSFLDFSSSFEHEHTFDSRYSAKYLSLSIFISIMRTPQLNKMNDFFNHYFKRHKKRCWEYPNTTVKKIVEKANTYNRRYPPNFYCNIRIKNICVQIMTIFVLLCIY